MRYPAQPAAESSVNRVLLVRGLGLYLPIMAAGALAVVRPRTLRVFPAGLLGFIWTLPSLLALQLLNLHFGWWQFPVRDGLFRSMPLDLYLGWAVLWGVVPCLAFRAAPVVVQCACFVALDLLLMPLSAPVVVLNHNWLIGELVGACLVLVPAQLLARWTLLDHKLALRAVAQVILAGGVFLFLVPE